MQTALIFRLGNTIMSTKDCFYGIAFAIGFNLIVENGWNNNYYYVHANVRGMKNSNEGPPEYVIVPHVDNSYPMLDP
jgi:hypothetical protein